MPAFAPGGGDLEEAGAKIPQDEPQQAVVPRSLRRGSRHLNANGRPKRRYHTRGEAKAAMLDWLGKRARGKLGMSVYRCDECLGFHYGHDRDKLRRTA